MMFFDDSMMIFYSDIRKIKKASTMTVTTGKGYKMT